MNVPRDPEAGNQLDHLIRSFDDGNFSQEIEREFAEVTSAVKLTGKKGSMTITVEVKAGTTGALEIGAKSTPKVPKAKAPLLLRFADEDGQLYTSDPGQKEMDFEPRAVETEAETDEADGSEPVAVANS